MATILTSYNFPDSYYNDLVVTASAIKYVSASGSNSNNGNTATTPYLTIAQALSATSSTATSVAIVILAGTYNISATGLANGYGTACISDGGNPRIFVCCPGQVIINCTDATAYRDFAPLDFVNSNSAIYGAILKRNNGGRTNSYSTSFLNDETITFKGKAYNTVFQEVNANNTWSIQYDNNNNSTARAYNCTFYTGANGIADYSGSTGCVITDSVFNYTYVSTTASIVTSLTAQTVNSSTYATSGVTTKGVYSGTYSWVYIYAQVTFTGGSPTTAPLTIGSTTYTIYTFTTSGTITISAAGAIDLLVVGGGGGGSTINSGGWSGTGGGGAGGVVYYPTLIVTTGMYTITVGSGGTNNAVYTASPSVNNGVDSVALGLTAKGGGGGGDYTAGASGGSGGGGGYTAGAGGSSTQATYTGATTSGNAGGLAVSGVGGGGGGGGAGAVGSSGSSSGGAGGIGISYSITGSAVTYAAGGGGGSYNGAGGAGGNSNLGGRGGSDTLAAGNGTINTGSGGGGTGHSSGAGGGNTGGLGGSGVVIIRATQVALPAGLYSSSATVGSGSSTTIQLVTTGLTDGTTVAYTITGVTSAQLNGTSLTGNFTVTSNNATITIPTNSAIISATMTITTSLYNVVVPIAYPVTITTATTGIGYTGDSSFLINPIQGQMNITKSALNVASYDLGASQSLYPIAGQMNVYDSVTTVTDVTLGTQTMLPTTNNIVNIPINPYTTITTSIAGPIPQGIIKVFGDIPRREYWV
jgi:hypothetical protein